MLCGDIGNCPKIRGDAQERRLALANDSESAIGDNVFYLNIFLVDLRMGFW